MSRPHIVRSVIFPITVAALLIQLWSAGGHGAEAISKAEDVGVTPSFVREIQFRVGMEPRPTDGMISPQTTRSWLKLQQDTALPQMDLVAGSKIPAAVLARLHGEASRVFFVGERRPGAAVAASAPAPSPAAAVAATQPDAQFPDRFAACPLHPEDFKIGGSALTKVQRQSQVFD